MAHDYYEKYDSPSPVLSEDTKLEVDGKSMTWAQYVSKQEDDEAESWANRLYKEAIDKHYMEDAQKHIFKEIHREIRRQVKNYKIY